MLDFEFEGYKDGKKIKGKVVAEDERAAVEKLKGDGLVVYRISVVGKTEIRKGLKDRHLIDFLSFLLDYMSAGIPMVEALDFIGEEVRDRELVYVASYLSKRIKEGLSLSAAMEELGFFDRGLTGIILAGEKSGDLTVVLKEAIDIYTRRYEFKRKLASAMTYPAVVFFVSVFVIIFLVTFVIPRIISLFQSSGQSLPMITRVLISVTSFFSDNAVLVVAFILVMVALYLLLSKKVDFQLWIHRKRLRMPIVGKLESHSVLYIYMSTLSSLLRSGIVIDEALEIAAGVVSNLYVRKQLSRLSEGIARGETISSLMEECTFFPKNVIYMVGVGEQTGNLVDVLQRLSFRYRSAVEEQIHRFVSLFEPIMILVVGGIVAFIVISILLPILSISTLVK
ncbi:MAG: type II secretion system F family protein [Synergistetes bacterium]|nr:type II secretion system F family protein [Synergistota bacterium]